MAVITWDELAKNQEDGETIEQAIARLIAEHNDNPEAHLGENQSLQSHRAIEIIDHAIDSIVEDRIADGAVSSRAITSDQIIGKDIRTDENVGDEVDGVKMNGTGIEAWENGAKKVDIPTTGSPTFKGEVSANKFSWLRHTWQWGMWSIDGWVATLEGNGAFWNLGSSLKLKLSTTINDIQNFLVGFQGPIEYSLLKNPLLQFAFKMPPANWPEVTVAWGVGNTYRETAYNYFGFKFSGENEKAYAIWYEAGESEQTIELVGIDPADVHLYTAEVNDDGMTIKYFVDGVLFHTATPEWIIGTNEVIAGISGKSITTGEGNAFIWNVLAQQDI